MTTYVPFDRDQPFLLPPDLQDWLPADDIAHFIVAAVDRVRLGAFCTNPEGRRQAAIPSAANAGAADLLLRQRHLRVAADRAGDVS
jgi:hypothetical protein